MSDSDEVRTISAAPDSGAEPIDAQAGPSDASGERKRVPLSLIAVIVGLLVLLAGIVAVWGYVALNVPARVPPVVGMTPVDAERTLNAANLVAGSATYYVTTEFPSGRVIAQSPVPYSRVRQGSAVNVRVAVAPVPVAVPDVSSIESGRAQAILRYYQLLPILAEAYSTSVPTGLVIEQLPRAGDTAMTGSSEVVVVSLGPGTMGATVPSLIGKKFPAAVSLAASATLFAEPRAVIATGFADGTVADQTPSAGSKVLVGSKVWVSVVTPPAQ